MSNTESLPEDNAKAHERTKPEVYVCLKVTDSGLGMSKETMQRIFEPFFTTKPVGKGTGLGLAMVYGVVKNHRGHIYVNSQPGLGSMFTIYLPVHGKPENGEGLPVYGTSKNRSEVILIVDDEESVRSLARDMLESCGYTVLLAGDGVGAINVLKDRNGCIDLVVLDMVMPEMGGHETFLKMKALNPKVKALLSTGYGQNREAREILDSGVMGFLQKPYDVDGLLSKVRSVLDGSMDHVIEQQSAQ